MTHCFGVDGPRVCPLKDDCYRHTQPSPGRDRLGALPFDFARGTCALFVSNVPSDEFVRTSAYYLWLAAGRPEGRALAFWDRAQRQARAALGRAVDD